MKGEERMDKIKNLVYLFVCITTGSTLAAAIFISVFFSDQLISSNILWQILVTSAICSLGSLIYPNRQIKKQFLYLLNFIHYFYIIIIEVGAGILFDWFDPRQLRMVLFMVLLISVTFLAIMLFTYKRTEKETLQLNERLQEYKNKKPL